MYKRQIYQIPKSNRNFFCPNWNALLGYRLAYTCCTSSRSSRLASIGCFHTATMKRVLSTGDIASSTIGDNSIDNGGPFTQQKGRRKKQRKANPVTITNSITNDTAALQSAQSTQSTQCIAAPASQEFSLLHNNSDELLCTARSQQETIIIVLSEKLNFVLSFLDAPGGLALQGGIRCAVGGSADTVSLPKPSTSSLAESQEAPDQPHPAQPRRRRCTSWANTSSTVDVKRFFWFFGHVFLRFLNVFLIFI